MIVLCREHFGLVKISFLISKELLAVEKCCVIAFLGFIGPVSLLSLCIFLVDWLRIISLLNGGSQKPPPTLLIRNCDGKNKMCHSSGGGRDPARSAARAEKWGHGEGVELNEIGGRFWYWKKSTCLKSIFCLFKMCLVLAGFSI